MSNSFFSFILLIMEASGHTLKSREAIGDDAKTRRMCGQNREIEYENAMVDVLLCYHALHCLRWLPECTEADIPRPSTVFHALNKEQRNRGGRNFRFAVTNCRWVLICLCAFMLTGTCQIHLGIEYFPCFSCTLFLQREESEQVRGARRVTRRGRRDKLWEGRAMIVPILNSGKIQRNVRHVRQGRWGEWIGGGRKRISRNHSSSNFEPSWSNSERKDDYSRSGWWVTESDMWASMSPELWQRTHRTLSHPGVV